MRDWLIGVMAGCLGAMVASAAPRDHVTVVGSSTVYPYATAVAEMVGRGGRVRTPVVESTGTGAGFRLFCAGAGIESADVNAASRPITDAERAGCAAHGVGAIQGIRIGSDGIVVANARGAPAFELSRAALYRAVARTVPVDGRMVLNPYHRWRELDPKLPDLPIRVYGPAPNHGTRDVFVAVVLEAACEQAPAVRALSAPGRRLACQTVREDGPWIDVAGDYALLLGKLAADPEAVALLGFGYLEQNRDRVQAARIDGVAPSLESIGAARYPLARPLFLYVKPAHVGSVPGLAEFLQEFVSPRAAGPNGYLADKGLTPMPPAALEAERGKVRALTGRAR